MSSLPASIERIGSKTTEKRWRHRFPNYKSMGAFCCHGNQSFDPIFPETLCSLSPTPVMLHIKFDQDWPTGFRDIQVWKCGRRTTYDGRRTDDGPLVYYKLTLWAFGSGELKIKKQKNIVNISKRFGTTASFPHTNKFIPEKMYKNFIFRAVSFALHELFLINIAMQGEVASECFLQSKRLKINSDNMKDSMFSLT